MADRVSRHLWRGISSRVHYVIRAVAFAGLGLLAPVSAAPQSEAPLSARTPLIDAAARAETDGYARIDALVQRSAALPDVYDPASYAEAGGVDRIRGRLLEHVLWLQSREASHLEMIESLPQRLAKVPTGEPYGPEFVALYAESSSRRYALVQSIYQAEISAAEHLLAFVDGIEAGRIRPTPEGFTFQTESDAADYRQTIVALNQSYREQDLRIGEYHAWEIQQKAALRKFRDQL